MKARKLIALGTLLLLVCGCRIDPPLHLRQALDLEVDLELDLDVETIWQVDWETRWQYQWNTDLLGPLGYEEPSSIRMHSYAQGPDGKDVSHQTYNFTGHSGHLKAVAGTYDFLFHNNDSEAILFTEDEERYEIYAYTHAISSGLKDSSPVKTRSQKATGTKALPDELPSADDPVVLAPESLFTLYRPGVVISEDPAAYEYIDGRYVIRIGGVMRPADFIWLFQIRLHNNNGRVVGSAGGCALTGMAEGVSLRSGVSSTTTVSVPTDVRVNRAVDPDLLGARLISFGIPGCNAYDPASVAAAPAGEHFFVLSVAYNDGGHKNIHIDVTDQLRALPTGGVITLDLDVNDFPPDQGQHDGGGGGFDALLKDWQEERGGVTIIQ